MMEMDPWGSGKTGRGWGLPRLREGCALGAEPHLFGILDVHHEVVHMLLCLIKLQLPGHHSHQQGRAADPLWAQQSSRALWAAMCHQLSPLEPSPQPQMQA